MESRLLLLAKRRKFLRTMCIILCGILILSNLPIVFTSGAEGEETSDGLADSPWPKYGGNNKNTGQSPYDTSHVDGTELWRFGTDDTIRSSPVIGVDGTIYVGSNDGNMYAVNPDGTEKWRFETDDSIRSSPVIGVDGTIYVGSRDYNVYAINTDGTEKWRFDIGGDVSSPPAIGADGTIYIGSLDGRVHAINPDGSEKWNFTTGGSVHSSPAIDDYGTIYVGSGGRIFAINPNGTEKWRYGDHKILYSTPAIGSDGTIYTVQVDGLWSSSLLAIETDGTVKWRRFNIYGWIISSPAISEDGTIFFGVSYRLFAVNPDGTEKWNISTYGGKRISIGGDGTIYARSPSTDRPEGLGAIHPDGSEIWNFSTEEDAGHYDIGSSAVIGEDGTIYFGSLDGNVYAIGEGHHLTINEPLGNGSIELDGDEITEWPYEEKHGADKTIDLTAVPNEGWYFSHWTGDVPEGEEYDEEITVIMDDDKGITAHFEEYYTLTINIEGEGSINPGYGTYYYVPDEEVTINVTAAEGWYFSHWSGDVPKGQEGNEEIIIVMDSDKELTAHFEAYYTLTINIEGKGSTQPEGGGHHYVPGEEIHINATALSGWYFSHWSGDVPEVDRDKDSISLIIDDDKNITARFIILPTIEIISPEEDVFETGEITIEWRSEEGTYPISYYEVRLNDGGWLYVNTATSHTFTITNPGDYNVTVRAVDDAGNAVEDNVEFTVRGGYSGHRLLLALIVVVTGLVLLLYHIKRKGVI